MAQHIIQENAEITLGYWGIRGLGQPIRFMLVSAGVPFSEVRLGVLQDGTLLNENKEGDDWTRVKATLQMPFPNLPYLIDASGEIPVQISQSNAILRYLARRFDFYGDSERERIEIDVLQDEAYDFRNEIIDTAYTLGDSYTAVYENFVANTLPHYLQSFESYLSSKADRFHFVGNRLSLVDFILYELMWQMTRMAPGSITETNRPHLNAYLTAFEAIPEIAAYRQSEHYINHPINSPWASFA
ncbi:MAG: glutathione S-transferase family protein [Pseudomonadota bacterium]